MQLKITNIVYFTRENIVIKNTKIWAMLKNISYKSAYDIYLLIWGIIKRCNKYAHSYTNSQDKGVLTASKFSAGYADRGPGNRRNSTWCERSPPTSPRLVTPYRGATWLVFNFQIYFMPFAFQYSRVFSAEPIVPPLSLLPRSFRLDSIAHTFIRFTYIHIIANICIGTHNENIEALKC